MRRHVLPQAPSPTITSFFLMAAMDSVFSAVQQQMALKLGMGIRMLISRVAMAAHEGRRHTHTHTARVTCWAQRQVTSMNKSLLVCFQFFSPLLITVGWVFFNYYYYFLLFCFCYFLFSFCSSLTVVRPLSAGRVLFADRFDDSRRVVSVNCLIGGG